jgi:peptidoglycan/LPS O-acetylase OafA/YrhL
MTTFVGSSRPALAVSSLPRHFPALDWLRGIAALGVAIYHFGACRNGYLPQGDPLGMIADRGYLGVQWFFVVSGFIVPLTLWRHGYRLQHAGTFLAKRIIRLYPPYLVSLALVLIWFTIGSLSNAYTGPAAIWSPARLAAHLVLLAPWLGQQWYLEIYWTLAIEFQFYLLVALLFPLLFHPQRRVRFALLLAAAVPAIWCHDTRLLASFAVPFALGLGLAQYCCGLLGRWHLGFHLLFCCGCYYLAGSTPSLIAGLIAAGVILGVRRGCKASAFLGRISYSMYLTHILVWMLASGMTASSAASLPVKYAVLAITLPLCVIAAWGFWRVLEKPSLMRSKRLSYK